LNGDDGEKLGDLLFRLVKWMIAPPAIDLTVEGPGERFQVPEGTSLLPSRDQIPLDILSLVAANTSYFW
jgi:hypothetical protein